MTETGLWLSPHSRCRPNHEKKRWATMAISTTAIVMRIMLLFGACRANVTSVHRDPAPFDQGFATDCAACQVFHARVLHIVNRLNTKVCFQKVGGNFGGVIHQHSPTLGIPEVSWATSELECQLIIIPISISGILFCVMRWRCGAVCEDVFCANACDAFKRMLRCCEAV